MFYRVSSLSVMAVLLLSPTLVCANEINQELDLSVGNIQIQTDSIGGVRFQTPSMYLNTIHPFAPRQRLSHYPRRFYPSFGRGYSPSIIPYTSSVRGFATRTSWDGKFVKEQNYSISCYQAGTSISQFSRTINGRTSSSVVRSNCGVLK